MSQPTGAPLPPDGKIPAPQTPSSPSSPVDQKPDLEQAAPAPEAAPLAPQPANPDTESDEGSHALKEPLPSMVSDGWFEAPPAPTLDPEPATEAQVMEVPIQEEPREPAVPQPVDESRPMAEPAREPSEPEPEQAKEAPAVATLVVRYGLMQQLGEFAHDLPRAPLPSAKVVVRTERGVELGDVLVTVSKEPQWRCISSSRLKDYIQACGPEYPYTRGGKVLRMATPQDIIDFRHLETSAGEEGAYCRQQIRELNLPMRLVTVEHLLGGERIVFYFSSETRVDFRELVRRLAAQFRTRIEMRQVGARDEARLVGDYERCGQRCCCQEYLKDLRPVSMRMAKMQKATLDPSKISGRCGRLMCCLRYEDAVYEDLRKRLPKKNIWVRTEKLVGKVIDVQIITQLVRLLLPDNTQAAVALEEITERDVPAPALPQARTPEPVPLRERPERRMLRDEISGSKPDARPPRQEPAASQPPTAERPQEAAEPVASGDAAQPDLEEGMPAGVEDGTEEVSVGHDDGQDGQSREPRPPGDNRPPGDGRGPGEGRRRRRRRGRRGRGAPGGPPQGQPQGQGSGAQSQGGQAQPQGGGQPQGGQSQGRPPQGQGQFQGQGQGQGGQGQGRRRRRRRGRRGHGEGGAPGGGAPSGGPPAGGA